MVTWGSTPVGTTLLIVLAVFLLGALVIAVGEARVPGRTTGAWRIYAIQILVSAWLLVPISFGTTWFRLSLIVTAAIASWELYSAVQRLGLPVRKRAGIAISTAYVVLACLPEPLLWSAAPVFCGLALLAAPVFERQLEGAYARAASTWLASLYPGLCLGFAALLPNLGNAFGDVVFLYCVLEINDAFAFLGGRYFGERKFAPRLSPGKTVAGSVTGIVAAVAGAAALGFLQPRFTLIECMAVGAGLAALGQTGDLTASAIKRQAGIKDYSQLANAQGGVLDLYDAFIFCAPIWYVFLTMIGPSGR